MGGSTMDERFHRTQMLLGEAAMRRLARARVAVFGIGGVGGYAVEALARSGVGALDLIDADKVHITNINRQILALQSHIGRLKVEVAAERIGEINPVCRVRTFPVFYLPETAAEFDFTGYDYVVDAIDTVAGKLSIIEQCIAAGVPVISAMGAGNKLDPTAFTVADIADTRVCPLARVMRRELRKRGIEHLKVVYSREEPISVSEGADSDGPRRATPGSIAFVPSVAGLIAASEVVADLTQEFSDK